MDEAVAAARGFLLGNGVKVDENAVKSLTADIFNDLAARHAEDPAKAAAAADDGGARP